MIKKILIVMLVLFMVTGCKSTGTDLTEKLDATIQRAIESEIVEVEKNNCKKTYYSYYKHTSIGKADSDEISNTFIIEGNEAALCLDIASIVSYKVYANADENKVRNIGNLENAIYTKEGIYTNSNNKSVPYQISVTEMNDGYFVLIQTSEFVFVSTVDNGSLENVIYDMLLLLRSCKVNKNQVISVYTDDSIIAYETELISLFNYMPESGYLIDYFNQNSSGNKFITIDNSDQDDSKEDDNVVDDDDILTGEDQDDQQDDETEGETDDEH